MLDWPVKRAVDSPGWLAGYVHSLSDIQTAMRSPEPGSDSPRRSSDRVAPERPVRQYTPEILTREFADNDGVRWTVREIVPEPRSVLYRTLLTRPGYEHGWLSFRSESLSCRIAPFPSNWRVISDYELERWCMKARDAARIRKLGGAGA
jgi:hypothetical protein